MIIAILHLLLLCYSVSGIASYKDGINATGWDELIVNISDPLLSDYEKCRKLGYEEGFVTPYEWTEAMYWNWMESEFGPDHGDYLPSEVTDFMINQMNYVKERAETFTLVPYWKMIWCVVEQYEGMYQGYKDQCTKASKEPLDRDGQLAAISYLGDLEDIIEKFKPSSEGKSMDCTIIVAPSNDGDILFAHNTHNKYGLMNNRVFKHLEIHFTGELKNIAKTHYWRFSSWPLDLESKDDFFILSSGLIVAETSLLVFNHEVYEDIEYESVPMFIRAIASHYLSDDIETWFKSFTKENSGTHMAEWIILDQKRTGQDTWQIGILDSIPLLQHWRDITSEFNAKGYWASYNTPFFEDILNRLGYSFTY
jgi:hypothetical protein